MWVAPVPTPGTHCLVRDPVLFSRPALQAPGALLPFPPLASQARGTAALRGPAAASQLALQTPHLRPSAAT